MRIVRANLYRMDGFVWGWYSVLFGRFCRTRVFPSKQKPRPKYRILRASVLHKYAAIVYLYIFIISPQTPKTGPLHHLCTTAAVRVNKCRVKCSQPIGVIVNNRRSECSHGEWRLCTSGNDTDFTVLPCLYKYAESQSAENLHNAETDNTGFVTVGCCIFIKKNFNDT